MIKTLTYAFAALGGAGLTALLGVLVLQALPGIQESSLWGGSQWDFRHYAFGSLAMFQGSAVVCAVALGLSVPISLGAALFISEFLSGPWRGGAKVAIELLAGVPSVVYGLLGAAYLAPLLLPWLEPFGAVSGDTLVTGGILLALMILPTLTSFSDDALRCVPREHRLAGRGLGLQRWQVIFFVVLPQAKKGLFGAALLGMGRALGETIAVYLVVGRADRPFSWESLHPAGWFQAGQTLTTKLGGSEISIAYGDPRHWGALMALGLILWISVGSLSWVAQRLMQEEGAP